MPADKPPAGLNNAGRPEISARLRHGKGYLILLFLAALLAVDAVFGDKGLFALRRAKRQHEEVASGLMQARRENARLREEVQRLYEPSAVEEIARRELGLIKPGEILFIVKVAPHRSAPSR
jgi:cell division protein FtsB